MKKETSKGAVTLDFFTAKNIFLLVCLIGAFTIYGNAQNVNGSFTSKFKRYQKAEVYSGTVSTTWSDTAWNGDRIHKQIILWSSKKVSNLNYTVSNLTNGSSTIPSSNIRLRFGAYVIGDIEARTCDVPPAYPPTGSGRTKVYLADALSTTPITTIFSTDPIKIWVTVDVPAGTAVGNYTGTIVVKAGTTVQQTFNVNILVTNTVLPPVANWNFHLDIWQFPYNLINTIQWGTGTAVTPFSSQYFSIQKPFYKLLADIGQKSITAYMFDGAFKPAQSMVKWILNADQTWSFDYTDFDKYVDSLTAWGYTGQINCFSILGWQTGIGYYDASNLSTPSPNSPRANYTTSPGFNATWTSFLTQLRNHLVEKNWFNRAVIYLDEIPTDTMDIIVPLIKAENANWKIGYSGKYLTAATESQIYDYSIILNYASNLNNTQGAGTLTNFYTSCSGTFPNNYITPQNSTAEMPWLAWHARKKGYDGFLRWAYDYWTNLDPTNMQDGANTAGDFEMIYRTDNTVSTQPISSIRLELLRDGIQDFEKIAILGTSDATLTGIINQFTDVSGSNASALVQNGQSRLKQLAASQPPSPLAPTITSFTPSSGPAGTIVTITGTNFTGATAVSFGGTAATTFTVVSSTSITATVGTGTTGVITVTTPNGTIASSTSFTVSSNAAYCTVAGGTYQAYYLQNAVTTGASSNINYSNTAFPSGGYAYYTTASINTLQNSSFTVNLTNSSGSNCARTTAWIDWNGNGSFADAGEMVFSGGTFQSCANPTSYSFTVTVPSTAAIGITRMRIQIRDSWEPLPVSCGTNNYTETTDFNINIQSTLLRIKNSTSPVSVIEKPVTIKVYPNPAQNELMVQAEESKKIMTITISNSSGQFINQFKFAKQSGTQIINSSKLAAGLYFLTIELTDGNRYVLKFIK